MIYPKQIQEQRTKQWSICCLIIIPIICVIMIIFGQWKTRTVKTANTKVSKEQVLKRSTKVEFVNTKKVRLMLNQFAVLNKN